ncbi:MAG: type II secretion system F family protein [Kiritimatiellae bacterium]|nr:type II secretion system F family protein [Kiritimatiellia bacterium]
MAQFSYKARSRDGRLQTGTVDATDRRGALAAVSRLGFVPISVETGGAAPAGKAAKKAAAAKKPARPAAAPKRKKKSGGLKLSRPGAMSARERLLFTSELADLLEGGMTLGAALAALARREEDSSADGGPGVVAGLRDSIVGGASFSDSLARYPKAFTPVYVNMIRAGEASGALADVLRRLIEHDERTQAMRSKITSAMAYPAIVLCMGVGVAIFAMTYILPKFQTVFEQMGPDGLPPMTKALLGANDWIKANWILVLAAVAAAVFGFRRWTSTERGRLAWDGFKLRAPLVKGIVASATYANFAGTLESLMRNGVPILRALELTAQTVGNAVVGAELRNARERVTDGTTISGPLEQGGVFPPAVIDLIAIGERTGDMPAALAHVAKRYESELSKNILLFTTALEPLMIFVVAGIIGFIAVSIMQAVLSVTSGLNAG